MLPPYLQTKLEQLIEEYHLGEIRDQLVSNTEPYINVYLSEKEDYKSVGNSRIGGYPDLPPSIAWPCTDGKYLTFIAQINLDELPPHPIEYLPKEGLLYFFEGWNDLIENGLSHKVIYYHGDRDDIQTTLPPEGLTEYDSDHDDYIPHQLAFNLGICLTDAFTENNSFSAIRRILGDKEWEFLEKLYCGEFMLWGQPEIWGNDPRAQIYLKRNGMQDIRYYYDVSSERFFIERAEIESRQGNQKAAAFMLHDALPQWITYNQNRKYHEEKIKDWQVLLKVPSFISTVHMIWGDAGYLEFLIEKKDIEKLDFSKTGSDIESS